MVSSSKVGIECPPSVTIVILGGSRIPPPRAPARGAPTARSRRIVGAPLAGALGVGGHPLQCSQINDSSEFPAFTARYGTRSHQSYFHVQANCALDFSLNFVA